MQALDLRALKSVVKKTATKDAVFSTVNKIAYVCIRTVPGHNWTKSSVSPDMSYRRLTGPAHSSYSDPTNAHGEG
jgi:hypothetical protein